MEHIEVNLNDGLTYDLKLKAGLPECGDLMIVTKDKAMSSGAAGALITFTVETSPGKTTTVQAATSVKLLQMALAALQGRYTPAGFKRPEVP